MEYKAYAKINLCLKVLGKSDEMHELDMINAKINLYDETWWTNCKSETILLLYKNESS